MKSPVVLAAIAVVLLAGSTASAGWVYGPPVVAYPPTVVHSFYPVGPVYAYPAPVVPARVVYRVPLVYRAPVAYPVPGVYAAPGIYPAPVVYPAPAVIRSKVYFHGQPVRNAIRAVLP